MKPRKPPPGRDPSRPRRPKAVQATDLAPEVKLEVEHSPFHRLIGLELTRAAEGEVEMRLPWQEAFRREEGSDWYHGGVLSALIDIAGDYAIASKLGRWVPTIDLRVDYLRPAKEGALTAVARAVKIGRTVGVADVELRDGRGAVVAIGRGAYSTSA